jgi:threonine aldolase
MGNQAALAVHTRPGDSVIFEDQAHMVWYEGGAPAVMSGVVTRGIPAPGGMLEADQVRRHILKRSVHTPGTSLVCLENTHNRHGGAVMSPQRMAEIQSVGLPVHLDGARVFNAAAALDLPVEEITRHVDTVSFCLSKGLCCPVGSVLCGPKAFIEEASFWVKRMGGGMRQAGILAACGIVALRTLVDRLAEDHARAKTLAEHCSQLPGLRPLPCPTNILILETEAPASAWQEALGRAGVLALPFDDHRLRAVFHREIQDQSLSLATEAFTRVAESLSPS